MTMQAAFAHLVVAGGCPLQRAALGDWLHAHGFGVAGETDALSNSDRVTLFLCSEHDPVQDLSNLAHHHPCTRTIAILSCTCDRALGAARALALPNVFCADEPSDRLAVAIRAVLGGEHYQSPTFKNFLSRDVKGEGFQGTPHRVLTRRELDVLRLLAQGLSKKRIAETLHLSVKTVDNHSTSIMSKLNIHNRVDLARYAIREGLAIA